jgi:hypothetical protein
MQLDRLPFFEALEPAQTVLLAGASGGYNVFTGLPLYFALRGIMGESKRVWKRNRIRERQ